MIQIYLMFGGWALLGLIALIERAPNLPWHD